MARFGDASNMDAIPRLRETLRRGRPDKHKIADEVINGICSGTPRKAGRRRFYEMHSLREVLTPWPLSKVERGGVLVKLVVHVEGTE